MILSRQKVNLKSLNQLLPYVAIGTVADCQSILEPSNRLLVKAGLQAIQQQNSLHPGLAELLQQTKLSEKIGHGYHVNSQDLGFTLSPILNSSGRISHANLSIQTLLAKDPAEAKKFAIELIQTNKDRKAQVKVALREVDELAKEQVEAGASLIWLEGDWGKGLVGLIASRLVNHHNLPVIVISLDIEEQKASASLRAPEGYNLPQAMLQCQDLLLKFGGHPCAAGFGAKLEKLGEIKIAMSRTLAEQDLNSRSAERVSYLPTNLRIESLPLKWQEAAYRPQFLFLQQSDLRVELLQQIMDLDPYGQDFTFPVLFFKLIDYNINIFGNERQHAKTKINSEFIELVFFNLTPAKRDVLEQSTNIWIKAKVSQNAWNGKTSLGLIVDEFEVVSSGES